MKTQDDIRRSIAPDYDPNFKPGATDYADKAAHEAAAELHDAIRCMEADFDRAAWDRIVTIMGWHGPVMEARR